ncbi:MAG: hypothetical protein ACI83O_000898 [Patescibacteria group bacterium]|jgi:hypothetical protein
MAENEYFYGGAMDSMNSENSFYTGFHIPGGQLSQSIDPSTANQVDAVVKAIKTGLKGVEVQLLGVGGQNPDQTIPRQHFKEMRALMKLSGVKASMHGPLIEASGFGQQGWTEFDRLRAEKKYDDAMDKAYELNPKGNTTIVFHAATSTPGETFLPDETLKPGEKGRFKLESDFAVDRATGRQEAIKREGQFSPFDPEGLKQGKKEGEEDDPLERIDNINRVQWKNKLTELAQFDKAANEIMGASPQKLERIKDAYALGGGRFQTKDGRPIELTDIETAEYNKLRSADIFLSNIETSFNGAFDKAFEFGSKEQKEKLITLSDTYVENRGKEGDPKTGRPAAFQPLFRQDALNKAIQELQKITQGEAPKQFVHANKFFLDKTSDTFANVAADSYKKFGDNMPTVAIENYKEGIAFNRAKDLKELIEVSREKFAKKLNEDKGINLKAAQKIAADRIGATWDVGHVHLHKQYGFADEDFVSETKEIIPVLKHLHLTDNFGYEDSHLVPGMGNVPIKEHLEALEKAGVLDKVQKVVEAGGYIQQLSQKGVHGESMSAFGSSIYGMKMDASWKDPQFFSGNYFGGLGAINPSNHHTMYGAGFSNLPAELGGQIPGGGSRFSGNSLA